MQGHGTRKAPGLICRPGRDADPSACQKTGFSDVGVSAHQDCLGLVDPGEPDEPRRRTTGTRGQCGDVAAFANESGEVVIEMAHCQFRSGILQYAETHSGFVCRPVEPTETVGEAAGGGNGAAGVPECVDCGISDQCHDCPVRRGRCDRRRVPSGNSLGSAEIRDRSDRGGVAGRCRRPRQTRPCRG